MQAKPQLLIVDDEQFNVELLRRIFNRTCDVGVAYDGREALEMMVERDYDVVLLDIMMPVLNGLDVLKIIRNTADISRLPVILISAISDKNDVARGIRLGANDYIIKPIDVDTVQARVNTQITLKRMSDERHKMIARLQSANEMKARMMQVASHDLKSPLTNLKMMNAVMKRHIGEDAKLNRLLNMSEESVKGMIHIVEDFLSSSAANDTEIRVNLKAVDIQTIIKQVINQYALAAHNKNITLHLERTDGLVIADPKRMMQVIGNLVSNAIKYAYKGTTVTLKTTLENNLWRLYVIDQGPGIRPEEHEFLFQPFSKIQISTKPTDGEESTGLGLWIVHEMMKLQDGRVGLDSPDDGGCAFWIELPTAPNTAEV
jgi:two-component system sensor histidine kinase/response regulator